MQKRLHHLEDRKFASEEYLDEEMDEREIGPPDQPGQISPLDKPLRRVNVSLMPDPTNFPDKLSPGECRSERVHRCMREEWFFVWGGAIYPPPPHRVRRARVRKAALGILHGGSRQTSGQCWLRIGPVRWIDTSSFGRVNISILHAWSGLVEKSESTKAFLLQVL